MNIKLINEKEIYPGAFGRNILYMNIFIHSYN